MFTELSPTSSRPPSAATAAAGRSGTIGLEFQSALKFGLAVGLGATAVWGALPTPAAGLILLAAVVLASRALIVLGTDPSKPRTIRPREHAHWDGALAAILASVALVTAMAGETAGAAAVGVTALALALLRLRTRYVA